MSVNGTLAEDKMRGFKGDCAYFSLNKCPIHTHDGASAKFITNSDETDYRVGAFLTQCASTHSMRNSDPFGMTFPC